MKTLLVFGLVVFFECISPLPVEASNGLNGYSLVPGQLSSGKGEERPGRLEAISNSSLDNMPGEKPDNSYEYSLKPIWTTGIVGEYSGISGIIGADLDSDGVTEIISCSKGSAFALNPIDNNNFITKWYSEKNGYINVVVGDRDHDGIKEVYAATQDSNIVIYSGDDFSVLGSVQIPSDLIIKDLEVADVDHDCNIELVVVNLEGAYIYDANTLQLEWSAIGKGGKQLGIGDIDNDGEQEIVVNDYVGHILNAAAKTEEWAFAGGFGHSMAVGEVDGDGVDEIVYIHQNWIMTVFDADTLSTKWEQETPYSLQIALADLDGDQNCEIITEPGDDDNIRVYKGVDGTLLWELTILTSSCAGLSTGDTDNDGVLEILWGDDYSDSLFAGDWQNNNIKWFSDEDKGPFRVASGDLDCDGSNEVVVGLITETHSSYGAIRVYDGSSFEMKWSGGVGPDYFNIKQIEVGQLDLDPNLEIVVAGVSFSDTYIKIIDGVTYETEWTSPFLADGTPCCMVVRNIDADSTDEIIIGLPNRHVLVFDGPTHSVEWDSGILDDPIVDLHFGDPDGNDLLDLAILTEDSLYIYETGSWLKTQYLPIVNGHQVCIINGGVNEGGTVLVAEGTNTLCKKLRAMDGVDYNTIWQVVFDDFMYLNELGVYDLDFDDTQEFYLLGEKYENPQSLLLTGSEYGFACIFEYENTGFWGEINGIDFADLDKDGRDELLFGSDTLVQVNRIDVAPKPKVKVNGFEDQVYISSNEPVEITISLDGASYLETDADWWIKAETPFGQIWFTLRYGWRYSDRPITAHSGPIFNFQDFVLFDNKSMPEGEYKIWFGVDLEMDGIPNEIYWDSSSIFVE